ncbi:unnamed protein product [Durusdinium trenchii]|uniref:EF-hand domain-containing protein n=1 Tax=Durusdinium trenchii TaxID=1381693 RepID=A0ABP0S8X5_9DINO
MAVNLEALEASAIEEVLQRQHVEWLGHLDSWLHRLEFKLTHCHVFEGSHTTGSSGFLNSARPKSSSFLYEVNERGYSADIKPLVPSSPMSPASPLEPVGGSVLAPPVTHVASNNSRDRRSAPATGTTPAPETTVARGKKLNRATTQEHRYQSAKVMGDKVKRFKKMVSLDKDASSAGTWFGQMCSPVSQFCDRMANSLFFNVFFGGVIITNAIFMGVQLEWSAKSMDTTFVNVFLAANIVYAFLFSFEMLVRIAAVGPISYFCSTGCGWNWLDVLVVVPAWVEIAIEISAMRSIGGSSASSQFRIIRVFKVTRLLQVVRSIRLVRFLSALRALVLSVIDTTRQLLWALILLTLVQYSFGIMFTDAVLDYIDSNGPHPVLQMYFGTVYLSCATLFRSILGGTDWDIAADALEEIDMLWVQLFHLYIAFCGFAVLNVMTGVFVNSAVKTRERDHETLIQNKQKFMDLVSKITIIEFERMFDDEEMKAFFQSIEINAVDAWTLFDSLDIDGDHTISLEEFSSRCMQLHGPARSVDLYALKKDLRTLEENQQQIHQELTDVLHHHLGRLIKPLRSHVDLRRSSSLHEQSEGDGYFST